MFALVISLVSAMAANEPDVRASRDASLTPVSTVPAAAPAPMSPQRMMSMALVAEVNALRTNPAAYARHLEAYRDQFVGMDVYRPTGAPYRTREGVRAVDEAINELRRRAPMPPLAPEQILELSALDHVADQGPRGGRGHFSSTGLSPTQRAGRHGFGAHLGMGETISYGHSDPRDVVIQLVVDDAVADRGHREVLLDPSYKSIGAGCGPHRIYSYMCVIDLGT